MSYRRSGLGMPGVAPTTYFANGMAPYAARSGPAGALYAPYGWGPDFMTGMPLNYTHHIDYVSEPVPGARPLGPMRDVLGMGCYEPGPYEGDSQSLGSYEVDPANASNGVLPQRVRDGMGDSGDGLSGL